MKLPTKLRVFAAFALLLSTALGGKAAGKSMVIHIQDVTGAPVANIVVLVTPGDQYKSLALLTGRNGSAILRASQAKPCVVTAIDPRRMFFTRTTEAVCGATPSMTLRLAVRPIIDTVADLGAIHVIVQVKGADGAPLAKQAVVVRMKVGTMEDDSFSTVTADRKGQINLKLRPGEYVLASLVDGRFLEAPLNLAPTVGRKCSEAESDCYIANAVRNPLPAHLTVRLAPPGHTP